MQERLAKSSWTRIPGAEVSDSKSVAELGRVTLEPAEKTLRDDGTPYPPVTVRVVVSRMKQSGEAQRGVVRDGWQYEAFLTDLPVEAWPAAETVAAYHGRSALSGDRPN